MSGHLSPAQRDALRGELERQLKRLDAGAFGRCIECDDAVPFERPLIFPEAPTCVRRSGH
ncbi:MAG TPA: hypothetical protein VK929_04465 [Longimicrobiales bacterium]|nr:hypothetical protein [Longimicrobiales bacterium]